MLLARGARLIYAVDVGRDQLHRSLRGRAELVSFEGTDIRELDPARLAEPPDFVTVDASFISLELVLPAALALGGAPACLLALIKPQFEAGRRGAKKGLVRDPARSRRGLRQRSRASSLARLGGDRHRPLAHCRRRRQPRVLHRRTTDDRGRRVEDGEFTSPEGERSPARGRVSGFGLCACDDASGAYRAQKKVVKLNTQRNARNNPSTPAANACSP